ncbi:MAG: concanavalin A-like lectin/glucanase domain-containing protein [Linnemannia gamsii]|nr:MAG: concanavalin A-like lectin/glucanase domain-containing protein [Linnemannia gamsii]
MRYISTISALVLSASLAAAQSPQPESLNNPAFSLVRSKVAGALAGAGTCKNAPGGGSCPQNAPCCSGAGFCGSDPAFCADDCQASGSFAADSCWPLPMAINLDDQFKDKTRMVRLQDFNGFPDTADWIIDRTPGTREHAVIENDHLVLKLNRVEKHPETGGGIGATVHSSRWMKYGTIEARIKTASNMPGTVSSFILISPTSGDEIDFEVVGKDPSDMQTNFYYRVKPGNKVDYSHGVHVNVGLDTSLDFHTYRLDWTPTEMKWWFDGELKRTTLASEVVGSFPDTPMRIAFGIWDGGHGSKGTAEWAGENTSYEPNETREYQFAIDWVKITPMEPANSTEPWPGAKYRKQMEEGQNNGNAGGGIGNGGGSSGGGGGGVNIIGGDGGWQGGDNAASGRFASARSLVAGAGVALATVVATVLLA